MKNQINKEAIAAAAAVVTALPEDHSLSQECFYLHPNYE